MRILLVCPDSPYPPRDGGSLRIVNLARSLAQHASVMLLTYVVSADEAKALAELEHDYAIQVRSVQRPARRNTLTRAWLKLHYYYGSYLFTSLPGPVRFNTQPAMRQALLTILKNYKPDTIAWEYWFMSGFAELARAARPQAIQVLDAHDLEWIRIQRSMTSSNGFARIWNRYTEPRIKRYALGRYRRMDRVVFLSEADVRLVQRDLLDADRLSTLPMGLWLNEYLIPTALPQPERVLFFGSFRHQPNVDALRFLLQDIWPRIQRERPQATLDLMGSSMPPWVRQATQHAAGIRVLGFQSDVRPSLAEASVVIAPLRFGSGVKIKILEAMALGKAVVTTPIGAEGIEAQAGADFIVADDARSLATETIQLLADPARCESIGQRARQFIRIHHDADEIAQDFLAQLDQIGLNREPVQ